MTPAPVLRVALWNIAWRRPESPAGVAIRAMLEEHGPDLICLTEAHRDFLPGGHAITAEGIDDDRGQASRRKVVLWSRQPWREADAIGARGLPPGRFVAGETQTPLGLLRVVGVCVPWDGAHVLHGRRDRSLWEEHRAYLEALTPLLAQPRHAARTVLLGDLNQAVPRRRAPGEVHAALLAALAPLTIATAGRIPGLRWPVIDHLAHSHDLAAVQVQGLPNRTADGLALSDHPGLVLTMTRAAAA